MLQEKLRDALIEHAREGKTIAFSAAAKALGLKATDPADRNTVSSHLNRIARTEHAQGRPLLTALVVKAKDDCPGEGFFATAEELGRCADDHETFFKSELQRVFDHWRHRTLYETNREWSDKFIPLIKQTVGPHLLDIAPFELDTKEATDLIVFRGRDMRIAARVRKPGRTGDALWEFTLRSKAKAAKKTELDKVIEGWGDLMFYAHASEDEMGFDR